MQKILDMAPPEVMRPVVGSIVLGVSLNAFKLVTEDNFGFAPGTMDVPGMAIAPLLALYLCFEVACLKRKLMQFLLGLMIIFSVGFASQEQVRQAWEVVSFPEVENPYSIQSAELDQEVRDDS
ncbi:MAG: hypothetical protein AAF415_18550 [Pseudomonadota bacterium]